MKNKLLYVILAFLLTLPFHTKIMASSMEVKNFTFSNLGIKDGLSSQHIYSIYQTSDGAIWWTTRNGVDRSNGSIVRNYILGQENKFSNYAGKFVRFAHVSGKITGLYAYDNNGYVYIYNPIQDRFDEVINLSSKVKTHIILNDLLVNDEGLWFAENNGVYHTDISGKGQVTKVAKLPIVCISSLDGSNILLCTTKGTYTYNTKSKKAPKFWLPYNATWTFYDRVFGKLWLGTFTDGVKVVNMKSARHEVTTVTIPTNPVRAIAPFGPDRMLIGIDGYGVYEASRSGSGSSSVLFSANDGKEGVIHGNGIYSIFVDSWSNIIIGSYSGGIDIARPIGSTTAILRHIPNSVQSLGNNHVNCVCQSETDELYMGTDNGVSIFNSKTGVWRHIAKGKVVLDICKKPSGGFVIATYGNGACEIDANGNTTKTYNIANGTLKDDHVYCLCYDKAGNLWMGTLFGDLMVKTTNGIERIAINNIYKLFPLKDGRMAIGTAHGMFLVSLKDKKLHKLDFKPEGTDDFNDFVLDICMTPDNRMWIATDGGGVYIYDMRTHKSKQITTEQGLPTNAVTNLTYDGKGRIWFGTARGLAFAYINKPQKVIDINYCFGLNAEYCQHAVCKLRNGDILYGTVDGAIIIRPRNIRSLSYRTTLKIRGVRLHNIDNEDDHAYDDFREHIARDLERDIINLSYDQSSFDINFESINFRNQFDIVYQYRMEDGEWSQTTDQQYISFENLEPGKHTIYIRCISKSNGQVLDEKMLTIYIAHPWWSSWWMWCFYLLLLAIAFRGAWWIYKLHNKYMRLVVERVKVREENTQILPQANNAEKTDNVDKAVKLVDESETISSEKENSIKTLANENNDIADDNTNDANDTEADITDEGSEFIKRATKIVLDNLKDSDFTIDSLCREMGLSRTLFYVKVKTYTGNSPQEFIRAIRLERAGALIRQNLSVTEVSALTGFDNPKYFSTVFKKYFGVSPSKYE